MKTWSGPAADGAPRQDLVGWLIEIQIGVPHIGCGSRESVPSGTSNQMNLLLPRHHVAETALG
jgi:hypothetical protein